MTEDPEISKEAKEAVAKLFEGLGFKVMDEGGMKRLEAIHLRAHDILTPAVNKFITREYELGTKPKDMLEAYTHIMAYLYVMGCVTSFHRGTGREKLALAKWLQTFMEIAFDSLDVQLQTVVKETEKRRAQRKE